MSSPEAAGYEPVRLQVGSATPEPADPVRTKVAHAWAYVHAVESGHAAGLTNQPGGELRKLVGTKDGERVLVCWDAVHAALTLVFGHTQALEDQLKVDGSANNDLTVPAYMKEAWPKGSTIAFTVPSLTKPAGVYEEREAGVAPPLDASLEGLRSSLLDAINELVQPTDNGSWQSHVRRISICGFAAGGELAVLAAPWAVLQAPAADSRVITFGGAEPVEGNGGLRMCWGKAIVANEAFMAIFKHTVGMSFDVSLNRGGQGGGLVARGIAAPYCTEWDMPEGAFGTGVQLFSQRIALAAKQATDIPKDKVPGTPAELARLAEASEASRHSVATVVGTRLKDGLFGLLGTLVGTVRAAPGAVVSLPSTVAKLPSTVAGIFSGKPPAKQLPVLDPAELAIEAESATDFIKKLFATRLAPAAEWSAAAYKDQGDFRRMTERVLDLPPTLISNCVTDAQGYVGLLGRTAIFCFRGTTSLDDWKGNFDFQPLGVAIDEELQKDYPGMVHEGFLRQLQSLKLPQASNSGLGLAHELARMMREKGLTEPDRVICVGHSLGGALATLGAVWASFQYPRADVRCLTFGQPHCGDIEFVQDAQLCLGMYTRAIHGGDIVPSLLHLLKFAHLEPVVRLQQGQLFLPGESAHARPYVLHWCDHSMDRYIGALGRVLGLPAADGATTD